MIEQKDNSLLYLETPTNDEVQISYPDAHMSLPKDSKQQHALLLLPWWNLEVRSPTEGMEYNENLLPTHLDGINK